MSDADTGTTPPDSSTPHSPDSPDRPDRPRRSWIALLPASKGTEPGGDGPAWRDACDTHGRQVAEALAMAAEQLDDDAMAKLTESPPSRVAEARMLAANVVNAPTLPAMARYTGAVHAAADPASLPATSRKRFARHIAYLSALGGLVHADAPLPAYRLPMSANLHGVGALAAFWRGRVESALAGRLAPGAQVWVLTGGEYERALAIPVGLRRIDVAFVEDRRGVDASPPSAAVKQARGMIARRLAQQPGLAKHPDGLGWQTWTFEAGKREFHLESADSAGQIWRSIPLLTA